MSDTKMDYGKKRDKPELSNYIQINVDDMDSTSFRRAMRAVQEKIDQDRRGRMRQIDELEDECAINDVLMKYWDGFVSSEPHIQKTGIHNWAETALQALVNLAPCKPGEDGRLPRPEGAFDKSQFLSNTSMTILKWLKFMENFPDEKNMDEYDPHDGLFDPGRLIQELRSQLVNKMDRLKKEHFWKTTEENYFIPLDSPHASEAKPGEKVKPELLNPNRDPNETTAAPDTSNGIEALFPMYHGQDSPSAAAMEFAKIQCDDYQASQGYISLHPEILHEFESTGLLILAVENALFGTTTHYTWQLVYQAEVLDRCRLDRCRELGADSIADFFKKMITQDNVIYKHFEKHVWSRYCRILALRSALLDTCNNRYVPARRPDMERSEPKFQFQTARMGRCGKRGLRVLTGSPLGSRPRRSSRSTQALSRKLEMMNIG